MIKLKRLVDILLVLLLSPLLLPTIAILAALVWRDGHSPFYTQARVGMGGKHFKMWKLRSMIPQADAVLAGFLLANPTAAAEWNFRQKLSHDPRITGIGDFIRRTSMDELPQIWNVLKGEMSLIGPRPMLPSQQVRYRGTAYYGLRPGMTGLWQVSERNSTDFEKRAIYDTVYAKNLSPLLDTHILIRTFFAVIYRTGR